MRGTANEEPMSVDTILKVGRAAACVFRRADDRRHKVLIGKDTRLSGYMFETALASGLCSMGVDVVLLGPVPTPAVAFLTNDMRADAGVMISASHNPYNDNGIKFFGPDGFKLADAVEESIEQLVMSDAELDRRRPDAEAVGKAHRLEDARGRYISYLKHNFPRQLSLDGVKMVVDCAHGAAYKIAPVVFSELGADVTVISAKPNGKNINENCGAVHPQKMIAKVKEAHARIGLALDGDADRVVVCDETGRIFDGDDLLAILAESMKKRGELKNGVVGTVMSNFGLEKRLEGKKIPFHRAPVGDRYVVEKMKETGAELGGEPSGHIVNLLRSTTGDGILTCVLLLAELRRQGKPLSSFYGQFDRYPQELRNVEVREKRALEKISPVTKSIRQAEKRLNGTGRVLVRYSGTEAKIRVMVEGEDHKLVSELADEIATVIQEEIGAS
ncbi:MAG TPA: phosphoglucosamine mutase [Bdellovibrionota bacterium]|nr:phosphoglucosamine mutase [Bdellovibrionota bacterium]